MSTVAVNDTPGLRDAAFWYLLGNGGLQEVAWSDPQADGYGDKRRIRRPWDV